MAPTVRRTAPSRKKATLESASIRLHEEYGESPATWQNRMFGAASDYQQVVRINGVLRELGLHDKVADLMAPVLASIAESETPKLDLQIFHVKHWADCLDDLAQEEFRDKFSRGEATVQDAREFLKRSTEARRRAEDLERATVEWIREQGEHS